MSGNVTIRLTVPERVVRRLEWMAGDSGRKLEDEVAAAIQDRVETGIGQRKLPRPTMRQRIAGLVREGLTDADIADRVGLPPGQVATHRRNAGLAANRRYVARTKSNSMERKSA